MNEKICRHCGFANPHDTVFCGSCGNPFAEPAANEQPPKKTISRKTMFLVSLAVTVVVNICLALVLHYLVPVDKKDSGSSCSHVWMDADCTNPEECRLCGEIRGSTLSHSWLPADCLNPEECSVCGKVRGNALPHMWVPADCTHGETCSKCGATNGAPLGHLWTAATYTAPETCSVCKATSGASLVDVLRQNIPFTTYSTNRAEKVYGYEDAGLTKKSDKYYFVPSIDELVITDISADGTAVQVRYPSRSAESGYRALWFPIEEVIVLTQVQVAEGSTVEKRTTYRLDQKNSSMEQYGAMGSNSTYTILGTHDSGYIVVFYRITETTINGCKLEQKVALIQP